MKPSRDHTDGPTDEVNGANGRSTRSEGRIWDWRGEKDVGF